MRLFKYVASGVALLLLTTSPLLADGFKFYEFECGHVGVIRTKDQMIMSGRDPTVGEDIVFTCDGRSCFNRMVWDDGEGNTGVRARHVYFPRDRMEFIFAFASWRDGEDGPYFQSHRIVSLLPCGF